MKKNVWIINHYAGNMFFNKGGRHYWFSKYLKKANYEPIVFCSNSKHGEFKNHIDTEALWIEQTAEEINVPFVFVRARSYVGNGRQRVLNMIDFYRNVRKTAKQYAKLHGKPDVIIASSVHPLTMVAGIQLAKKFGVKCICEVRDLWPESLVAYGSLKPNSFFTKILYAFEKRIYCKADRIIMTWPGGKDYICDKGWDKINLQEKIVFISNGIDLEEYKENILLHPYVCPELSVENTVKLIYAGSIRKVNNLGMLVEAAEILKSRGIQNLKILIFGDGDEREYLEKQVIDKEIESVKFMGKVPKQEIPSVLSQSHINILHNSSTLLDKYGQSQNKFFEYLASGRPVLMTYSVGHSIVEGEHCGIEVAIQSPDAIADAIQMICNLQPDVIERYSKNAEKCVQQFDFKVLTETLISLIEEL